MDKPGLSKAGFFIFSYLNFFCQVSFCSIKSRQDPDFRLEGPVELIKCLSGLDGCLAGFSGCLSGLSDCLVGLAGHLANRLAGLNGLAILPVLVCFGDGSREVQQ